MNPDVRLWIEALPRRWARNGAFVGAGLTAFVSFVPRRYEFETLTVDHTVQSITVMVIAAALLALVSGVIGLRTRAKLRRLDALADADRGTAVGKIPLRFATRLGAFALLVGLVFVYLVTEPGKTAQTLGLLAIWPVAGLLIGFVCGTSLRGNLRLDLASARDTDSPAPDDSETPARSRLYVTRHWRGELSLPVTYWVNGLLAYLVTALAVVAIRSSLDIENDFSPRAGLAAVGLLLCAAVSITTWQMVGIWRSASNFQRARKVLWGGAAKAMVVLGIVATGADLVRHEAPQIAELVRMAAGDENVGSHEFRVLRDGRELEFSGGITFGTAKGFARMLDSLPALELVHLDSHGGRTLEAQRIGDLVRRRDLAVHVADECLSACTIVFLSGRERIINPDAKLGFHQPDFPGLRPEERREAIAAEHQRLIRLGASETFAKQAMSAAPDAMWYPPVDDLLREGIVTRLASE